jgi:hypothetical protein
VFRVAENRVPAHAPLGAALGAAGAIAIFARGGITGGLALAITLGAIASGFAIGLAIGGARKLYRCATCTSFVDAKATMCQACGGKIVGDIARRKDRLDAEERFDLENRPPVAVSAPRDADGSRT